jgi:hypothetical protein
VLQDSALVIAQVAHVPFHFIWCHVLGLASVVPAVDRSWGMR